MNKGDLGDDLFFPTSQGFVMTDERLAVSQALTDVFLPARATTLQDFLDARCGGPPPPAVDDGTTVGGSAVGASN
jgi:hypothetical protein